MLPPAEQHGVVAAFFVGGGNVAPLHAVALPSGAVGIKQALGKCLDVTQARRVREQGCSGLGRATIQRRVGCRCIIGRGQGCGLYVY